MHVPISDLAFLKKSPCKNKGFNQNQLLYEKKIIQLKKVINTGHASRDETRFYIP